METLAIYVCMWMCVCAPFTALPISLLSRMCALIYILRQWRCCLPHTHTHTLLFVCMCASMCVCAGSLCEHMSIEKCSKAKVDLLKGKINTSLTFTQSLSFCLFYWIFFSSFPQLSTATVAPADWHMKRRRQIVNTINTIEPRRRTWSTRRRNRFVAGLCTHHATWVESCLMNRMRWHLKPFKLLETRTFSIFISISIYLCVCVCLYCDLFHVLFV